MRFENINAPAFGPLQGDFLELSPGMNVIYGPNEAGKSSWHAALYAGLCGMRRGAGLRKEEREFARRHRPWGRAEWEVRVLISLADGRRVRILRNLAAGMSRVEDADIASRAYANEIMHQNSPDGARWLNLNRQTFLSAACVRQTDILGILDDPARLQDDMQRAAASAARSATAASALNRLREYRREYVGSTQAPSRPLRVTRAAARNAEIALSNAREQHAEFLRRQLDVDAFEDAARETQGRVDAMRAVLAEGEAERSAERLRQMRELNEQFPDGAPRPSPERDALAEQVATALDRWRSCPAARAPEGPTAAELQQRIDDAEQRLAAERAAVVAGEAAAATARLEQAVALAQLFPNGQQPVISAEEEERARRVRRALLDFESLSEPTAPVGASAEEIAAELAEFDAKVAASNPSRSALRTPLLALGASLLLAGLLTAGAGLALTQPSLLLVGVGGVVAGVALGVGGAISSRGRRSASEQVVLDTTRRGIEQRLASRREEEARYDYALQQHRAAHDRIFNAIRELDTSAASPGEAEQSLRRWLAVHEADVKRAAELAPQWVALQRILGDASLADVEADAERLAASAAELALLADVALLEEACAGGLTREQLAGSERRANEQMRRWAAEQAKRAAADTEHVRVSTAVADAEARLREAAEAVGVASGDAAQVEAALVAWQQQRAHDMEEAERRSALWDEFQGLLAGQTLDEVAVECEQRQRTAAEFTFGVAPEALTSARAVPPSDAALQSRIAEAEDAREKHTGALGELREFAGTVPSVPDAEESLAAAERERDRVAALDTTLDRTIEFLADAQDRVHRNIAPILRNTVLDWLPDVTAGRYVDCKVNPRTLQVEVASPGGDWRDAGLLSRGTAEQVYLLLRLALTRHLTDDEPCPLILDDALAAADAQRKRAALDTLLAISQDTQVILFTHEEDVREWACERLAGPHHRLQELPAPAIA